MFQQNYPQVNHNYVFELNKDFNFSAAHYIPSEDAGKCMRTHGHTYFVNLTIAGNELDHNGFLVNFSDLKKLVHGSFDHQLLNELPMFKGKSPSTEVVAQTIYEIIQNNLDARSNKPHCLQVYVRETPTSYVVYRPKEHQNG
ncbi:MAG TPA: 6-carboxytetrahydropterin synthase QueD [Staphylococcus kloosii]|jgi:6-pyruvoyltetrahydropterin/6-carboxytetrahydropterin synthase|uniref:6-carboxy-5,6,7,8-tetrahydropterin synthase n=1 Tax=Staphylococcus kloosii TaxID=29384 RepID=A0A151A6Z1_9STAP|nr:6-carboxytetrahydropterin synthase QueD [Staphylococcus kloosii]KYH15132.1 6-carboxy-5,6,7,8-tetrahydropterin synthase [Staphylococcus kloosii]MBF7028667.1 6-carboxytetrahydropterin synthase QueD [Staphylococcus kloosii]MCD8878009.1 6-carboxytetrahydropterin synthase QueD [Staphylococcus kloosii]HJF67169.1 6-carboxytetrahydropterin synthase QueD [Staphylococcus kloosii]